MWDNTDQKTDETKTPTQFIWWAEVNHKEERNKENCISEPFRETHYL